jgi:N-acetylglutamate synthase-like GNAT family acetyltransferase
LPGESYIRGMANLRIRRATVEDLAALRGIWDSMRLPANELEKRLNEFQVAEDSAGNVLGVIGIHCSGQYALLYGEGYSDFSVADTAREMFWERVQILAANHGVFRIWTTESSPFWTRWGFQPANPELLSRVPEQWNTPDAHWLTLQLKDEDAVAEALNTKFAGFMDSEKQQTERVRDRAKTLRTIITVVGFGIFFVCLGVLVYLLKHRNPFAQ